MPESLADKIMRKIESLDSLYFRLLLVVAPSGAGKTTALMDVQKKTGAPLINVNLELSRLMLDLTHRQRALHLPRLIRDIIDRDTGNIILLDNIELLFDIELKQDPLRLLQGISRNKSVIASWNGTINDIYLAYAEPDHPEFKRYPVKDFLAISPEV